MKKKHQTFLSVPVKDCEGCPARAGVRNLDLDDPRTGRPDSPCNFGDRIRRSLANHAEYGTEIGKRVAEDFWCDEGSLASVGAVESDAVAHGFELVECPSLGSFGVEAGEVICTGVVVEGSGVADVPDGGEHGGLDRDVGFLGSAEGGDAAEAGAEVGTRVWAQAIAAVPGAPCR